MTRAIYERELIGRVTEHRPSKPHDDDSTEAFAMECRNEMIEALLKNAALINKWSSAVKIDMSRLYDFIEEEIPTIAAWEEKLGRRIT